MRSFSVRLGCVVGVWIGVLAAATLADDQKNTSKYAKATAPPAKKSPAKPKTEPPARGSVHRIELYSGTRRSVRYLPSGNVSDADRTSARELQRAENEESYLFDLERVKQQYASDERLAEQNRSAVQKELYGRSITREQDASNVGRQGYMRGYGMYGGMGGYGMYGGMGGYGLYGGMGGYGMYGGMGYGGYGNRYGGMGTSASHSSVTETRSLKDGVGDEGRIKDAMAKALANQASPEYANQVMHEYEKAMAHAASSPVLAKTLSLPKTSVASANGEISYPENSKLTLWIGGDRYDGVVKADRPSWIVLQTDDGEMRVRKSSIERSIVHVKPARSSRHTSTSK